MLSTAYPPTAPCMCWQWALQLHPDHTLGPPGCLCIAEPNLCSNLTSGCGVEWVGARAFASSDWEVQWGCSRQCKALSTLTVSKPACAHSSWVESRLLQPFCLSQWISQQASGLVSSMRDPRTQMPRLWLNLLTPLGASPPVWTFCSLQISPRSTSPNPKPFFFHPTRSHGDLSYSFGW